MDEHLHIYSFCGQPGCKDKPWHPNTEDLVSPALLGHEVAGYFADRSGEGLDPDTYVVRPCQGACPNPEPLWLFIRLNDPLVAAIRPNHLDFLKHDYDETWAKA